MMSTRLNFKVFGEGEPVVILHGLFGMLDNWQTFAKKLSEDYMVYVVDQRDHGKSPHTDAFSYKLLAEDLHEFLTTNWIYECRLIGHSMGGKTVMQFAADYEDMVQQMVVVDIAPVKYEPGHETIFQALQAVDLASATGRSDVEETLKPYIAESGVRQFLMKNLQRDKESGGFKWKMNLELLYKEYANILDDVVASDSPIEVDALFVAGGRSGYVSELGKAAIHNRFAHARIETIADAGHWIHAEKPDELLELVTSFFLQ